MNSGRGHHGDVDGTVRIYSFNPNVWTPAVKRARDAGLAEKPRVHDLRHTCASWLIQSDRPLPAVQQHQCHRRHDARWRCSIGVSLNTKLGALPTGCSPSCLVSPRSMPEPATSRSSSPNLPCADPAAALANNPLSTMHGGTAQLQNYQSGKTQASQFNSMRTTQSPCGTVQASLRRFRRARSPPSGPGGPTVFVGAWCVEAIIAARRAKRASR